MNFTSDNCYGASPEILAALARENAGPQPSYGDDAASRRLTARFSEIFEREVAVFPLISGTAANALALSTLVPAQGAILCHAASHIVTDECGAVELFSHGARLVPLEGAAGKLTPAAIGTALPRFEKGSVHHVQPMAVSLTNATELGTVYRPKEIAAIAEVAHAEGLKMHMDGARFANALASLDCSPAELTWRAGIDVLSFGAAKNGALGAEAVVFFDPALAGDFVWRRKKAGHLLSKMRFVAVQLEAYLEGGLWLRNAARANALARHLAQNMPGELATPVEANEVFVRIPDATVARLRAAGALFYDWAPSESGSTLIRLVTSFATPDADIAELIALARS
ncbi:MAG: low specificity L-threonine aldolase [Alphaproteobacteria bacterium]|nr:low specificity L-threonine aldolase [Alphaproteobacteria bacterium]MBV9694072.1 low specificity L-threonine aldolase [Alphaproteobacteria bacterium]